MRTMPAVLVALTAIALLPTSAIAQTKTSNPAPAPQPSLQLNVVYTCNGERLVVARCRSEADDAYCSVSYPDRKGPATGGLTPELAEKRGDVIKKLRACGALQASPQAIAQPSPPPSRGSQSALNFQPFKCEVSSASPKPGVRGNSTLSLGGGYVYEKKDSAGKVTSTEGHQAFVNTTFYLVDGDIENGLKAAGIPPIVYHTTPLIGTPVENRYSIFQTIETARTYYEGTDTMRAAMDSYRPGLLFGAGDNAPLAISGSNLYSVFAKEAKARYDCAMNAISLRSAAQITTDSNGNGTFPAVPAGAYFLFGRFKDSAHGGVFIWNLRVDLKPGHNSVLIGPSNTAAKP